MFSQSESDTGYSLYWADTAFGLYARASRFTSCLRDAPVHCASACKMHTVLGLGNTVEARRVSYTRQDNLKDF
jgi:hypothetical protein